MEAEGCRLYVFCKAHLIRIALVVDDWGSVLRDGPVEEAVLVPLAPLAHNLQGVLVLPGGQMTQQVHQPWSFMVWLTSQLNFSSSQTWIHLNRPAIFLLKIAGREMFNDADEHFAK